MKEEYRNKIYKTYLYSQESIQGFSSHSITRKLLKNYMKKNYLPYFPKDKSISVLDLGCGIGHYLFALREMGYTTFLRICRETKGQS